MSGQSRTASFAEAWVNVLIGFSINFVANLLILPLFGFNVKTSQALGIGVLFTVISVARSFLLRRLFNGFTVGAWLRRRRERQFWAHYCPAPGIKMTLNVFCGAACSWCGRCEAAAREERQERAEQWALTVGPQESFAGDAWKPR